MNRFATALLCAALALAFAPLAQAQGFPSKPIRILCPFPPGGGVDITARAIGLELSKSMGQPVTVENKPGAGGNGTNVHLVGDLFGSMAGVDIVHVPYKGSAPALTDMLAGNVTMMFETIPFAITQIKGGKLRALAATSAKRQPLLSEVPSLGSTS